MNVTPLRAVPALLLWLAGCQSNAVADLARNEELYVDTGYASKLPGDRTVFVAPLDDAREKAVPVEQEGGFPVQYDGDGRWVRPVAEMVDEVLRRELEQSGVFAEITDKPAEADVVVLPSLVVFATGEVEQIMGGSALAEVGVRLQVYGPVGETGVRQLLHDQVYGDRKLTEVSFRTASRHVLAGAAMRVTMLSALRGLDGKNVGREGMPMTEVVDPRAAMALPPEEPAADGPAEAAARDSDGDPLRR